MVGALRGSRVGDCLAACPAASYVEHPWRGTGRGTLGCEVRATGWL